MSKKTDKEIEMLVAQLHAIRRNPRIRESRKSQGFVLSALEHPHWRIRAIACLTLGELNLKRTVKRLKELSVGDPDPRVRTHAEIGISAIVGVRNPQFSTSGNFDKKNPAAPYSAPSSSICDNDSDDEDEDDAIDEDDESDALVNGDATLVCSVCGAVVYEAESPDYDPCPHGVYFTAESSDITPWMSEELVKLAFAHFKKHPEAFSISKHKKDLKKIKAEDLAWYDPEDILAFAVETLGWKLDEYSADWGFSGGCTWVLKDAEVLFQKKK